MRPTLLLSVRASIASLLKCCLTPPLPHLPPSPSSFHRLDKSWPIGFSNLLVACWDRNPSLRPSFAEVSLELGRLLEEGSRPLWPKSSRDAGRNTVAGGSAKKNERQSTWF